MNEGNLALDTRGLTEYLYDGEDSVGNGTNRILDGKVRRYRAPKFTNDMGKVLGYRRPATRHLGFMPGTGDEGIIGGIFDRLNQYYGKTFWEAYAPIKEPGKNLENWIKNGIGYLIFKQLAKGFERSTDGVGKIIKESLDGPLESYWNLARIAIADLSPLMRTCVLGYAPGKTEVYNAWVYEKGGKEFPIFFNTYDDLEKDDKGYPNKDQILNAIQHVERESESPFNHIEPGMRDLLNNDFTSYAADKYTGGCYKQHFQQEPEKIHRWFLKEDTKGQWFRDPEAELRLPQDLPAGYSARIKVYRKDVNESGLLFGLGKLYGDHRPKSWSKVIENLKGDFAQDIAYVGFGGLVIAGALHKLGVEEPGIRRIMFNYYKIGSDMQESLGVRRNFAYEM